jgi:hypothetical protein
MGTDQAAQNEKPEFEAVSPPAPIEDVPKTGGLVWVMFLGFLAPAALVVYVGHQVGPLPHQTLWVLLMGLPALILLLSLPRSYTLDQERLTIHGLLYRVRIPRERIRRVRRVGPGRALVSLGSVFCSDPARALAIERDRGLTLIISPRQPEPFLALGERPDEPPP